jgi:hypothetical protein
MTISLITPAPLPERAQQTLNKNLKTFAQMSTGQPTGDYDRGLLDQQMRMTGSALIAAMASLKATQRPFAVPEYLGFASWFGAMAVTPAVLNTLIRVKTGVNLGQQYLSPEGEQHRMFQDPRHIPFDLISDSDLHRMGQKMGIAESTPNYTQAVQDEVTQVAVQGSTLWMLAAGPATPVISAAAAHTLETPVSRGLHALRQQAVNVWPMSAEKRLEKQADLLIGDRSNLTFWWDGLRRDMTHPFALKTYPRQGVMPEKIRWLSQQLSELPAEKAQSLVNKLTERTRQVEHLQQQVGTLLNDLPNTHPLHAMAQTRLASAQATTQHLTGVLKAFPQADPALKKLLLSGSRLSMIQKVLMERGDYALAETLSGGPDALKRVVQQLDQRQFKPAFNQLGASPADFWLKALDSAQATRMWRGRYLGLIGGGLALLSAAYVALFVGKPDKTS